MPFNYVRKPNPPCPVCGVTMTRISQRTYQCATHGLIARYPRGERCKVRVYGATCADDDWVDGALGCIKPGKGLIFFREVWVS